MDKQEKKYRFIQYQAFMLLAWGNYFNIVSKKIESYMFNDPFNTKLENDFSFFNKFILVFFLVYGIFIAFFITEKKYRYIQLVLCMFSVASTICFFVLSETTVVMAIALIIIYGLSSLFLVFYATKQIDRKSIKIIQYIFIAFCIVVFILVFVANMERMATVLFLLIDSYVIASFAFWWYLSYKFGRK